MTLVRLEPAAIWSRVKHSTTEPLRSQCLSNVSKLTFCVLRLHYTVCSFLGKAFLPKMGSKKVIKHKKHYMLVHFHLKYYNCHSVMPLKYFRYYATDSEVLIFMSKGSNPNVYLSTRISPESEFLSFISFDKILH